MVQMMTLLSSLNGQYLSTYQQADQPLHLRRGALEFAEEGDSVLFVGRLQKMMCKDVIVADTSEY